MSEKTKKALLLVPIAIILMVITFFVVKKVQDAENIKPADTVSTVQEVKEVKTATKEEAKKTVKESCDQAFEGSDQRVMDSCISSSVTQLVNESGDESLCNGIANKKDKELCLDTYNLKMALDAKDPKFEYCNKIYDNEQKTACLDTVNYYLSKLNPADAATACNKLSDPGLREGCSKEAVK